MSVKLAAALSSVSLPARMLLIMLAINVFLGLVDLGMSSVNPDVEFFNVNETPAGTMTGDGFLTTDLAVGYEDAQAVSADSIGENTGVIFTDQFKSINSWWSKMDAGFGIATSILRQPAGFMKDIGFPTPIFVSFGIIWYGLGLMALIMILTGRT